MDRSWRTVSDSGCQRMPVVLNPTAEYIPCPLHNEEWKAFKTKIEWWYAAWSLVEYYLLVEEVPHQEFKELGALLISKLENREPPPPRGMETKPWGPLRTHYKNHWHR